jgi:hypothetical protein
VLAILFFRSFYGSSEPGTPSHLDSIPSNPLRPPSISIIPCPATAINPLSPTRRSQQLKINFRPYLLGFYAISPFNASNPPISCASVKLRRGLSHRKPPDGKLLASNHRQFRCYCPLGLEGVPVKQESIPWQSVVFDRYGHSRFETLRSVPSKGGPGDDDF